MGSLPGATSLARAWLVLARARATGVLTVTSGPRAARVAVADGTPRAIAMAAGEGDTLGEILEREGALDRDAHARALGSGVRAPVGEWLVSEGATTRPAVSHALRVQLRRRTRALLAWPSSEYRFERGAADVGVPHVPEPIPAAELVLGAMRDVTRGESLAAIARQIGEEHLVLTPAGEALLTTAPLHPCEAAMLPLLRRGASARDLIASGGASPRAIRALFAWRLLLAVAPSGQGKAGYALLVRKQRQLARSASPRALLDLPRDARPDDARRALRRLARDLHPDRFGTAAPEAVRRASTDVLAALVRAEATLRRA